MIHVVMQKDLATDAVAAVAAFARLVDARVWMNRAIDATELYGYKIESVDFNPVSLCFDAAA